MGNSYKELIAQFGNGRRENIGFTLNAGQSMILHFKEDGTDSVADKYYNLTNEAKRVLISNNKIATITHINNQQLKTPKTLGTANANTWKRGIEWGTIIVAADQDSTVFEVYAD